MTILKRFAVAALASACLLATPAWAAKTDFTMGMVLEPPTLDPTAEAAAAVDEVVYANIFEGLTRIGSDGAVQPGLAASWDISEDGKTYTFKLREGVTFHDGTTFDAEDVKFSLDRARAEGSTNAQKALFEPIESVDVVDPTTVTVTLKQPTGNFLFSMGWGDAVMVAPESAETNKTAPMGTGPFKFDKWARGSTLDIVRNDAYWGDAPALEKATFQFIADPAAAMSAMMAGDVDAFANFPAPESIPQFQADPRFSVVIGSTEGETILAMNNGKPPFDNVKVRQAVAHAIDRKAIIDGAMFGQGTPIGTHFAPHHPAYRDLVSTYELDLEKSKAMLRDAGVAEGTKIVMKPPPPSYARRGGEIIASNLRAIGFDVEIVPVEWAVWLSDVFKARDYDLTIVSHTEPQDISIYGRDDYYFDYAKPEFKDVMARLDAEADTDKRYALMKEAQDMITADAVNGYLFQLAKSGVWNAKVEGLWENSPIQANDLTGVRWTD